MIRASVRFEAQHAVDDEQCNKRNSKANPNSKEQRSKYIYYDYKANQEIPESELDRTLYHLERKKRSSLNKMNQRILETKEELKRIESERPAPRKSKKDAKRKIEQLAESETNTPKGDNSLSSRLSRQERIFRIGNIATLLSAKQKSIINRRSFENLKTKYQPYPYQWFHSSGAIHLPEIHRAFPMIRAHTETEIGNRASHRSPTRLRASRRSSNKTVKRTKEDTPKVLDVDSTNVSKVKLNPVVDVTKHRIMQWLPNSNDENSGDIDIEEIDDIDRSTLYSFAMNATIHLPQISEIKPRATEPISTGESSENEAESLEEQTIKVVRSNSLEEVKKCRYIRGFEPPYMRMPSDIGHFIFGKKA